ncbi:hypothetical protein [Piscinibacter sp.]|uniref:hypothetical protein n=1 Tax=Piscinibacter sp. TaxID=1903157 RepID=UPI003559550B
MTEVVDVPGARTELGEPLIPLRETLHEPRAEADVVPAPASASAARISEEQLTQRVLTELQKQVDVMLEQQMRDALAPAFARLTEALMREMRTELASTLRDVVARAVAQELSRHRGR